MKTKILFLFVLINANTFISNSQILNLKELKAISMCDSSKIGSILTNLGFSAILLDTIPDGYPSHEHSSMMIESFKGKIQFVEVFGPKTDSNSYKNYDYLIPHFNRKKQCDTLLFNTSNPQYAQVILNAIIKDKFKLHNTSKTPDSIDNSTIDKKIFQFINKDYTILFQANYPNPSSKYFEFLIIPKH